MSVFTFSPESNRSIKKQQPTIQGCGVGVLWSLGFPGFSESEFGPELESVI